MLKLACPCGFVHNLSPVPDAGFLTIPNRIYESLLEADVHRDVTNETTYSAADKIWEEHVGLMYQCPRCERLMWMKANEDTYQIYEPLK